MTDSASPELPPTDVAGAERTRRAARVGETAPVRRAQQARRPRHAASRAQSRQAARNSSLLRETAIIIVAALVLSWLIKSFLVQAFFIPSASMEDTLVKGDRVMVSRLVPDVFDIHHGDVVVFRDPGNWLDPYVPPERNAVSQVLTDAMTFVGLIPQDTGEHLIKRVIGLPGDHVVCCDADRRVTINGEPIDETYIKPGSTPSQDPFDETVPEGFLFVMGDNRQHSADSRYNKSKPGGGFVPIDNVVGTAFIKVWPLSRVDLMRNPGSVFQEVPEP